MLLELESLNPRLVWVSQVCALPPAISIAAHVCWLRAAHWAFDAGNHDDHEHYRVSLIMTLTVAQAAHPALFMPPEVALVRLAALHITLITISTVSSSAI